MKFEAINTEGEKVIGVGVAKSDETPVNGREIRYLFLNTIHWCDCAEFYVPDFDFIYIDTLKVINE